MNPNQLGRKNWFRLEVAVNFIIVAALICIFAYLRSPPYPSYSSLVHHDPSYYAKLAQACDAVWRSSDMGLRRTIGGTNDILPEIIWKLHPTYVEVFKEIPIMGETNTENGVNLVMGPGRPDYFVAWRPVDEMATYGEWKLWATDAGEEGGKGIDLYTRSKPHQ